MKQSETIWNIQSHSVIDRIPRAFDGAAAIAVINMFSDLDILNYLAESEWKERWTDKATLSHNRRWEKQVISKIDEPADVVCFKKFEKGTVEVWGYEKWRAHVGLYRKEREFWLYFLNGKLEQWGSPGDWSKEAKLIYEISYR